MPGHYEHQRLGEAVAAVVSLTVIVSVWQVTGRGFHAMIAGSFSFVSVVVGSQLPDIDAPTSVPRQRATRLLQLGLIGGLTVGGFMFWDRLLHGVRRLLQVLPVPLPPIAVAMTGLAAVALVGVLAVPHLLSLILPRHRGPLHDFWVWLVLVGVPIVGIYAFDISIFGSTSIVRTVVVGTTAGGLLFGVLVHLVADRTVG